MGRLGWGLWGGNWWTTRLKWVVVCTFLYSECWWPLVLEDVETDAAVAVDVGVVDPSDERDFGGFEGVVRREVDVQEEHAPSVRRVFRAHDSRLPVELVFVVLRPRRAVRRRVTSQVDQFLQSKNITF